MQSKFLQHIISVFRFFTYFDVRFVFEKTPHAVAHERVAVDNQATNFWSAKGAADELILQEPLLGARENSTNGGRARRETSQSHSTPKRLHILQVLVTQSHLLPAKFCLGKPRG